MVSLIAALGVLFIGYLFFQMERSPEDTQGVSVENVRVVDGQQIVEITAKGGYTPRVSIVKAGLPTILRVNTQGTFDCSSQISVPSLRITQSLPPSGKTDIALGVLEPGVLNGTCSMGMYPFELNVQK